MLSSHSRLNLPSDKPAGPVTLERRPQRLSCYPPARGPAPTTRATTTRRRAALSGAAAAAVAVGVAGVVVAGARAAMATSDASLLTRRGMGKFIRNDVEGSLQDFDNVSL